MAMKLYISGPMTGVEDLNRPAFADAAETLKAMGVDYMNPFDLEDIEPIPVLAKYDKGYFDNLRRDIKALVDCTGILLLKGWEVSYGARLEFTIANQLHMPAYRLFTNTANKKDSKLEETATVTSVQFEHLVPSAYWKE